MRKTTLRFSIAAAALMVLSGLCFAGTATPAEKREVRRDVRELRADRRDLRQDRRELRRDHRDLRQERRELRLDRRQLDRDRRALRRDRRQLARQTHAAAGAAQGLGDGASEADRHDAGRED